MHVCTNVTKLLWVQSLLVIIWLSITLLSPISIILSYLEFSDNDGLNSRSSDNIIIGAHVLKFISFCYRENVNMGCGPLPVDECCRVLSTEGGRGEASPPNSPASPPPQMVCQ